MPEIHLNHPGSIYRVFGPFAKKGRFQKFKETRDRKHTYRNELGKPCFQHDMSYGGCKDLARRTASDKVLRDKAFHFANNPVHDGYQRSLVSLVYKCFDKKNLK